MNDTQRRPRTDGRPNPRKQAEIDLRSYLATLDVGVTPSVHINGHQYPHAVICVDFGQPLKQVRLNPEEYAEMSERLRNLAKTHVGQNAVIRVHSDNPRGIHWAAVG